MVDLAGSIRDTTVPRGSVAIWWLTQAGFAFKSSAGKVLYVDPYLSDAVERLYGLRRLSLPPIDAEQVQADWVISSHEHEDHLDIDAIPVIARNNPQCAFVGPQSCAQGYDESGIPAGRRVIIGVGDDLRLGDVTLITAKADHGDLSPAALSLFFSFGGVSVWFTGDTALTLDCLRPLIDRRPDVLLPCINGAFGNMDAEAAARLTAMVQPRLVIPCHFWVLKEQNGDPGAFSRACGELCPSVQAEVLTPGKRLIVTPSSLLTE